VPGKLMSNIDKHKGIIVSYPRSGLNWLRYCIEASTGRRTPGRTKLVQNGEPIIYRTHHVLKNDDIDSCWCQFYNEEGFPLHDKVALLLRDYRESFLRVSKAREIKLSVAMIQNGKVFNFRNYFENIRAFHEFPKEKILIRYEDLITDKSLIKKIMEFFNMSFNMDNFDIDIYRKKSIEIYDKQHKSYTKEDVSQVSYHQDRTDQDILDALDEFVDKYYKDISDIYLTINKPC
jgi:hypothetical protein